jgi:hypothetical protein
MTSKKTTGRKQRAQSAPSKNVDGSGEVSARDHKGQKTRADQSLSQADSNKSVRRDAATGNFVDAANKHMERAWGKVYAGSRKNRKVA